MRALFALYTLSLAACYAPLPYEFADGGSDGSAPGDMAKYDGKLGPDLALPACSSLDEKTCYTRQDCAPMLCPGCGSGDFYVGCRDASDHSEFVCPAFCPQPVCVGKLEADCNASADCHAVYSACNGSTNCTAQNEKFLRCDDGNASCNASKVTCDLYVECPPGFTQNVVGSCVDGCVKQDTCCATPCTGKTSCQPCFIDYTCLPDGAVC